MKIAVTAADNARILNLFERPCFWNEGTFVESWREPDGIRWGDEALYAKPGREWASQARNCSPQPE